MTSEILKPCPFWWADNEEGNYHGPCETEDQAISEAYIYRAQCFDDPSQADGFWILQGEQYKNPEHSPDYPKDDFDNCPYHISGKPKYVLAMDITDKFYEAWNTRADRAPAADAEIWKRVATHHVIHSYSHPSKMGIEKALHKFIDHLSERGLLKAAEKKNPAEAGRLLEATQSVPDNKITVANNSQDAEILKQLCYVANKLEYQLITRKAASQLIDKVIKKIRAEVE